MGIREDVQTAMKAAFDGDLSDAVKAFTMNHVTGQTYDADTGEVVLITSIYQSRGVFERSTVSEQDTNVRPTQAILTVLQNELAVEPFISDVILVGGFEYDVEAIAPDPAEASWELTLVAKNDG